MTMGVGAKCNGDRINRCQRVADRHLWRFVADTDSGTETVPDDAGCTGAGVKCMARAQFMCIDDALRRQHQQQQCESQAATGFESG